MLQAAKIGGDQVVLTFPCNPTGYLVDGSNKKSCLQDLSVYFPIHVSESTTNYCLILQHVTVLPKISLYNNSNSLLNLDLGYNKTVSFLEKIDDVDNLPLCSIHGLIETFSRIHFRETFLNFLRFSSIFSSSGSLLKIDFPLNTKPSLTILR